MSTYQIKLAKLPTRVVPAHTVTDQDAVYARLLKGPVQYECAYGQAKAINTSVRTQRGQGLSMKAVRVNGEVVGYLLALSVVKQRETL